MENRNLRKKERFDFKIFGKTGVKVPISSCQASSNEMASDAKVSGELAGLLFQNR